MAFRFSAGGEEIEADVGVNLEPFITGIQQMVPIATDAANKSAKAMSDKFSTEFNRISSVGAFTARQIGGVFGQLGTDLNRVVRPLADISSGLEGTAGALTAVGGAAAAGVIGVALLAKGLEGLASDAVDLGEAAGAAGLKLANLGLLTDEETQFAGEMARATKAAAIEQDVLTVRLADSVTVVGELTEAWTGAKAITAEAVGGLGNIATTVVDFRHSVEESIPVVGGLVEKIDDLVAPGNGNIGINWPLNLAIRYLADSGHEAALRIEDANEAAQRLRETTTDPDQGGHILKDTSADAGETLAPTPVSHTVELQAEAAAAKAASEDAARARQAMLDQNDAIQANLKSITDAKRYWDELSTTVDQSADDATAAITKVSDAIQGEYIDSLVAAADDAKKTIDESASEVAKSRDEWERQRAQVTLQYANQQISAITSITQLEIDSVQQRIDAGQRLTAAQAAQGNAALDLQEALAIGQAGIQATLIGIETYAELLPFLTPLGAAAAGTAAAGLAYGAAVAGIVAHEPAQFQGYVPSTATPEAGGQAAIAAKGGTVPLDAETGTSGGRNATNDQDTLNQAIKHNTENTDRRGGANVTVGIDPASKRLVLTSRRIGKRDLRGRR